MKSYDRMAVWEDGENFIFKKEDVMPWLRYGIKQISKDPYYDADTVSYFAAENREINKEIRNINDDLIGLSVQVMNDWFFVNQELVKEYRNGKL